MSNLPELIEKAAALVGSATEPTQGTELELRGLAVALAEAHNLAAIRAEHRGEVTRRAMHYSAAAAWLRVSGQPQRAANALGASYAAQTYTEPGRTAVSVLAGLIALPFRLLGLA